MVPIENTEVTLTSLEKPKNSFREVNNDTTKGMVDLTGRVIRGDSDGWSLTNILNA